MRITDIFNICLQVKCKTYTGEIFQFSSFYSRHGPVASSFQVSQTSQKPGSFVKAVRWDLGFLRQAEESPGPGAYLK